MASIDRFLGKKVAIPEDRRYVPKQGLWGKRDDATIIFGLSQPALVLAGGFNDIEQLVTSGVTVREGDAIAFAITAKIQYFDAPIGGSIHFNPTIKEYPSLVMEDYYASGWIFRIEPDEGTEKAMAKMVDAHAYINSLKNTEGFRNLDGLKGGVSGMCKAVYSGIREQKIIGSEF